MSTLSNPVERAVWFIEAHRGQPIGLDEIAAKSGVSPWHLTRVFALATGRPVGAYLRARRLSEAARALAEGRRDILGLALESGYGSHEAFSRAFRDHFGRTPEQVRATGFCHDLDLTEPPKMTTTTIDLAPPRFAERPAFLVAGLAQPMSDGGSAALPGLWERFAPWFGHLPGQVGREAYGVCAPDGDGGVTYIAAAEVDSFDGLPAEMARLRIPAGRYAVFHHAGHVSTVRHSFAAIFDTWLPGSGRRHADAPDFELYGARFDPRTGEGGLEIWIPLAG